MPRADSLARASQSRAREGQNHLYSCSVHSSAQSTSNWSFEGVKRLNCDWVAEKRERCTESGILMEEFEESEDDEDPNKPGPVEAYAFRACGKACGTCE